MIIESSAYQTRYLATEEVMKSTMWTKPYESRRSFIGGSDARIIMGSDEAALLRLWRENVVGAQYRPACQ
jgi:predicted phage-related endonuclease